MSLRSSDLLPALRELPGGDDRHRSFREQIESLIADDAALRGTESAAAVSLGLWAIWDRVNVPDELAAAYAAQYPGLAADRSLFDQWQLIQESGPEAGTGFISGLKGKLAEFRAVEVLESHGYGDVTVASSSVQEGWDITAMNDAGEQVLFQVKTGGEGYADSVTESIDQSPGIEFLVGSELHSQISATAPELANQITDIGPDYESVDDITEGLEILADFLGIDLPDELGDLIPYLAEILLALTLIYGALKMEREFANADRTEKNKIHVVLTLTILSRFGTKAVLGAIGGIAGVELGSLFPGAGNLIGGATGAVAGAALGHWLSRRLNPHMLELALNITGLTRDGLVYLQYKARIAELALRFRQSATEFIGAVS